MESHVQNRLKLNVITTQITGNYFYQKGTREEFKLFIDFQAQIETFDC